MSNEQVAAPAAEQSRTVVLTSENAAAFYAKKLDLAPVVEEAPKTEAAPIAEEKPEAEQLELEQEKPPAEGEQKKPSKIAQRFSEMTRKIEAAEARAAAAETEAAELRGKVKPVEQEKPAPVAEPEGKPIAANFDDAFKYAEALSEWTTNQALAKRDNEAKERTAAEARDTIARTFQERQDEFKKSTADYAETLDASDLKVSNELRDAIVESDVGPQILYHLGKNPEDAVRIGKLTVGGMLREIGKLEARFEKKSAPEPAPKPKAEISAAPAPIAPLKGGNGAPEVPINSKGEFTGTPKQWRDLRRAGKIH